MRTILALPKWALAAGGTTILVVGWLAWYLASPLFISTKLVEDSPFVAPAQARAQSATGNDRAERPVGSYAPARPPDGAEAQEIVVTGAPSTPLGAADIKVVGMGSFSDRDQVHRATGRAILARMGDQAILRFESFRVTNGPDLHVLLSRTPHPTTHDEAYDGVYVGKLKASEGAFHYELRRDADLSGIKSVVVYCVPFRVIFTSAALGPLALSPLVSKSAGINPGGRDRAAQ